MSNEQHDLDVKVGRGDRRRPRRWSETEKRRIVAQSYAPGATVTAVAKRNDVGRDLVTNWRRHFGKPEPDAGQSAFVPVVVAPPAEAISDDGGDAETGLGVDLGGGLAFAAPRQGVALDLKGRGLIAHEASGFREWGASAALTWDPRPETDRGLALRLRQSWGGSPTGGMDALLGRETLAGLAANDNGGTASAGRLEAELGYGIAMFDGGFTGTPHLGFGLSDGGREYRIGWRHGLAESGTASFEFGLEATRTEPANDPGPGAAPEHAVGFKLTARW